jgi:hypothetical protein
LVEAALNATFTFAPEMGFMIVAPAGIVPIVTTPLSKFSVALM